MATSETQAETVRAILERVVEARGRLLQAEADTTGATPARLILTFDVGRVLLEPLVGGITGRGLEQPDGSPGWVALDEAEPWWRFRGNAATQVVFEEAKLRLRFREENENPKVVLIESVGTSLRVAVED